MRSIKLVSRIALTLGLLILAGIILAGCGGPVKTAGDEVPIPYAVPVAAGCIGKDGRPAAPAPLQGRYPAEQWARMPPGAKAQAVAAQAGKRMNFEDQLTASTAGCK